MASSELSLEPGGGEADSELRLLLLGSRGAGKTSAGWTILGQELQEPSMVTFTSVVTSHCLQKQGQVAGRRISLVDTPGWLPLLPLIDTSELYKCEIEYSATLCPPGPHCLLLVVPLNVQFTRDHRIAVHEHLEELFGESAWRHALVLFTHGDCFKNTAIQEVIQNGGKALQSLIERCGNRYHVLDNTKTGDHTQVTELLDKIEQMVRGNHGDHYEMSRERIDELELKKRTYKMEGEKRWREVQKRREDIRAQMVKSPQKLRILVMGYQHSGKSSTGNTILRHDAFSSNRTRRIAIANAEVFGRWQVTVVDTPGRWRIHPVKYTSELFKQEIMLGPSQCPPGPHAVLLVVPVNTSFTERNLRALKQHLELLGKNVWSHVLLLFTYRDWLGSTPVDEFVQSEGDALQKLVEQCGNRYHLFNNKQRDDERQVTELLEKIEEMVQENGGRHFEMDEKKLNEVKGKRRICVEEGEKRRRRQPFESLDSGINSLSSSLGSMRSDFTVCTESSDFFDSRSNSLCRSHDFLVQFQLVLMGYRRAGQTSSVKTILGMEKFGYSPLSHCVKTSTDVSNRSISVICTPGWEKTEGCYNTPDQNQEILCSVDLCSSGPVVFLLVLRASMSFCAETLKAMEEHVELLGEGVWDHTMLLFTYGDWLGDVTIEQHIETEGEALKTLVERCGNRYHVLDNYNKVGRSQVTSLLEKIEEMQIANGGRHFQVDIERFEEAKEKWKKEAGGGARKNDEGWREDKTLGARMAEIEKRWQPSVKLNKWWK